MKMRFLLLAALFISYLSALGRTYHDAAAFGFYGHVKEALEKNYYGQSKSYTPVEYKFGADGAVLEAASLGRNITVKRNNVGYIMEIEEATITNTRKIYKYYFDLADRLSREQYDATDARYVINTDYYYSGKNVVKETYPDKGPKGDPNNLHTCEYRDIKTDSHDNWVSRAVYVDGNYARRQERTITYWDAEEAPTQLEKPKMAPHGRTYHDAAAFGFYGHVKEATPVQLSTLSASKQYVFSEDGSLTKYGWPDIRLWVYPTLIERDDKGFATIIGKYGKDGITIELADKYYYDSAGRLVKKDNLTAEEKPSITTYYYNGNNIVRMTYPVTASTGDNGLVNCEFRDIKTDSHGNWLSRSAYIDGKLSYKESRTITYWDDDEPTAPVEQRKVAAADGPSWLSIGRNIDHTYKYDTEADYVNGREGAAKTVKDKAIKLNINHSGYGIVTFYGKMRGCSGIVPTAGPWRGDYDGSCLTLSKGYKDEAVTPVTLQLLEMKSVKNKTVIKFLLDGKTVITATECKNLK